MKIDRIRLKLKTKAINLSYAAATVYFGNQKTISLKLIIIILKKWAYLLAYNILALGIAKSRKTSLSFFLNDIKPTENFFNATYKPVVFDAPIVCIIINAVNCPEKYLHNCLASIDNKVKSIRYELVVITNERYQLPDNIKQVSTSLDKDILAKNINAKYTFLIRAYHQLLNDVLVNCIQFTGDFSALTSKIIFASNGLLKCAGARYENQKVILQGLYSNPNDFGFNYITPVELATETLFVKTSDLLELENFVLETDNWVESLAKLSSNLCTNLNRPVYYYPLLAFETYSDEVFEATLDQSPVYLTQQNGLKNQAILVVDAVYPTPDKDSGSRRLFELIKIFESLNLTVYFLAHEAITTEKYYNDLVNLGVRVFRGNYHREKQFSKLNSYLPEIDFAWISRPDMNEIYGERIKQTNPHMKWIYDTVDLHFIREQRAKQVSSSVSLVIDYNIDQLREKELKLASLADYTITVTDVEKDILNQYNIANVYTIPNIHPLQNIADKNLPFNEREGLLFIGSYLHQPNIDAAFWLVTEIMPLVWQTHPHINVFLLGSNPTENIMSLASDRVMVPGYIEDVAPYFLNSRIFVAPLRFGAGMKGKIGQSLEFGLPVVSTEIGVEGMYLNDEENCMVANDTVAFAAKIIRLYDNGVLWQKIHENSLNAIAKYSPESVTNQLKDILF
ncbi:glycosyltransferase [Pedobacter montanisoli]|uniref:Glycosyltransferase family 4 protein n=1 Tax=Pedobacter montanisoli TaxID=2923277 RepID=A0ABS9ZT04_9SPHI|nr:glycosyltransferase [Pedobacter montanisoli]MCJ0741633.1 glycosyltransferase family 4 protein [Pedobacter montanisoli]